MFFFCINNIGTLDIILLGPNMGNLKSGRFFFSGFITKPILFRMGHPLDRDHHWSMPVYPNMLPPVMNLNIMYHLIQGIYSDFQNKHVWIIFYHSFSSLVWYLICNLGFSFLSLIFGTIVVLITSSNYGEYNAVTYTSLYVAHRFVLSRLPSIWSRGFIRIWEMSTLAP